MKTENRPTKAGERTQHSPGPWGVGRGDQWAKQNVYDANCVYVASAHKGWNDDGSPCAPTLSGAHANARLIAAAPELLEVCKQANALLDNLMKAVPWGKTFGLDISGLNQTLVSLPRAIAKAEGRA